MPFYGQVVQDKNTHCGVARPEAACWRTDLETSKTQKTLPKHLAEIFKFGAALYINFVPVLCDFAELLGA